MNLDKKYHKNKIYGRILHSVRIGKKVKKIQIKYLGKITEEEAKVIQEWLRLDPTVNPDVIVADLNKTEVIDTKIHGNVALCYSLIKELQLSNIIHQSVSAKKNKNDFISWIEVMLVNRLCDPMSKYALLEWVPETTLMYLLGKPNRKLHENLFYRAMDKLWKAKDTIELKIWRGITSKLTAAAESTFYKDMTTTYLEGNCCEIAAYSLSKEHRPDLKQLKWGLVVTPEGYPVTLEMYRGDTSDKTTVIDTIKRLKIVFGLEKGIVIGDRGIVSDDNCKKIVELGYDYIFAEPNRNVEEIIEEALQKGFQKIVDENMNENFIDWFRLGPMKTPELLEICEIEKYGERWIISKSDYKKMIDEAEMERILKKGELVIKWAKGETLPIKKKNDSKKQPTLDRWMGEETVDEELEKELKKSRPPKDRDELIRSIAKKMVQFGGDKYFDYYFEEGKGLVVERKDDKIEKNKKYFGIWVLRTTTAKDGKDVVKMYRDMHIIEQGFRVIKSVLRIRPVNHRKPHRIESHIFICVIAFLVEKIIEKRLKENGINISAKKAIEKFGDVRAVHDFYPILKKYIWRIKHLDKEQEKLANVLVKNGYYITQGWGGFKNM